MIQFGKAAYYGGTAYSWSYNCTFVSVIVYSFLSFINQPRDELFINRIKLVQVIENW